MADDSSSLSQEEIDALLSGDDSGGGGGGGDELNLESLLGDDAGGGGGGETAGGGLDQAALDALTSAVGGPAPAPSGGGGGGSRGGSSSGATARDAGPKDNVDLLMDVTLRFTVELGRTQMYIRDVLMLGEGSVVELDKNVGDEVDILINERLFGRGRLVVLDEYFAVQITHILDPLTRFRNL
ncbi:MAG: flagellar motor switch protein FliN [Leptospiraceae bacterium]|nr:flagellar motor switch protein FliN [Leptospiraceae bacterium]